MSASRSDIVMVRFYVEKVLDSRLYYTTCWNYFSSASAMIPAWREPLLVGLASHLNRDFCEIACWNCEKPLSWHIGYDETRMFPEGECKCPFASTTFKRGP